MLQFILSIIVFVITLLIGCILNDLIGAEVIIVGLLSVIVLNLPFGLKKEVVTLRKEVEELKNMLKEKAEKKATRTRRSKKSAAVEAPVAETPATEAAE